MEFETHYVKSNDFRTVHSSGVFGGLNSQGHVNANFFVERAPIPKKIILDIDEKTGSVLGELGREGKEGTVREVHFGVTMDIETAKSFRKWLDEKIESFEKNLTESGNNTKDKPTK